MDNQIDNNSPKNYGGPLLEKKFAILHGTGQSPEATFSGFVGYMLSERDKPTSYHFLIDKNGDCVQMVDTRLQAFHAGKSEVLRLDYYQHLNKYSISIAFFNTNLRGDIITPEQISAAQKLIFNHGISYLNVLTHKMVSPGRKTDPDNLTVEQLGAISLKKKVFSSFISITGEGELAIPGQFIYSGVGDKLYVKDILDSPRLGD